MIGFTRISLSRVWKLQLKSKRFSHLVLLSRTLGPSNMFVLRRSVTHSCKHLFVCPCVGGSGVGGSGSGSGGGSGAGGSGSGSGGGAGNVTAAGVVAAPATAPQPGRQRQRRRQRRGSAAAHATATAGLSFPRFVQSLWRCTATSASTDSYLCSFSTTQPQKTIKNTQKNQIRPFCETLTRSLQSRPRKP